jgi:predicted O-linked N-acetylglucosamine transferase (SPINDLY family)
MDEVNRCLDQAFEYLQSADVPRAASCYAQALDAAESAHAARLNQLAQAFHRQGNCGLAIRGYEKLRAFGRGSAALYHNLGLAYFGDSRYCDAIHSFSEALRLAPDDPQTLCCLGNALREDHQYALSLSAYTQALQCDPQCIDALINAGIAHRYLRNYDLAIEAYQQVLRISPRHAHAYFCMGRALQDKGETGQALACYRRCIDCAPQYAAAHNSAGNLLQRQGKIREAWEHYQAAHRSQPRDATTLNNIGTVLRRMGRSREAAEYFRQCIALSPNLSRAHSNLGQALRDTGELDQALHAYRSAVRLSPDDREALGSMVYLMQRMCEWQELESCAERILALSFEEPAATATPLHPLSLISLPIPSTATQQLQCARRWAETFSLKRVQRHENTSPPGERIRIGYLSADFYDHPVAALIPEVFELHDREQFEVLGYSIGVPDRSEIRQRIANSFDVYRDEYSRAYEETAQQIADDRIDILVDLMGYTRASRTAILACRPARIQVNFLGFPGTMGADFIDYMLVDQYVVPPEQQRCYSEQLVYLPHCYLPCDGRRPTNTTRVSRQDFNLSEDEFIFCSFCNSYKITPQLFACWMELLQSVPKSRLWLLSHNRWVVENLCRRATEHGINADRLIFSERLPLDVHLARHRIADLFLDTFPYNGHTTASDALRCGLPLVTCQGSTFASRVAASLLSSLGLSELITDDLGQYTRLAQRLATERDELQQIKRQLENALATSPVFDGRRYTRDLEGAYRAMYSRTTHASAT